MPVPTKKQKKSFKRSAKKAKRSVKKSKAKRASRKLGDAAQTALETVTIGHLQAKLAALQVEYEQGAFVNGDAVAHLEKCVKMSHWVRSLVNQYRA